MCTAPSSVRTRPPTRPPTRPLPRPLPRPLHGPLPRPPPSRRRRSRPRPRRPLHDPAPPRNTHSPNSRRSQMATRTPVTPLYAIAGAGDLAVEKFRAVSDDVTTRFAKLDQKTVQAEFSKRQHELTAELTKRQAELTKRFEALVADARTAPAKLRELP